MSPYHTADTERPFLFNNVLASSTAEGSLDTFRLGRSNGGLIPDRYGMPMCELYFLAPLGFNCVDSSPPSVRLIERGASQLLADAIQPFCTALANNFDYGFQKLMEVDHYSTSMYLHDVMYELFCPEQKKRSLHISCAQGIRLSHNSMDRIHDLVRRSYTSRRAQTNSSDSGQQGCSNKPSPKQCWTHWTLTFQRRRHGGGSKAAVRC